jgi:hypothetical protein
MNENGAGPKNNYTALTVLAAILCIINGILIISWPYIAATGISGVMCYFSHPFFAVLYQVLIVKLSAHSIFYACFFIMGVLFFITPLMIFGTKYHKFGRILCLILGILSLPTGIFGLIAYIFLRSEGGRPCPEQVGDADQSPASGGA